MIFSLDGGGFHVTGNMENEMSSLKFKVKMTDKGVEIFSVRET